MASRLPSLNAFSAARSEYSPDPEHSDREKRFKAIDRTEDGRAVFVVFTLQERDGETLIRPISARYMRRKEIDYYEKEVAEARNR